MKHRYRVVPPGGGTPVVLEEEAGTSIHEAYEIVAALLNLPQDDFTLLLRNPPGACLPFFHLRPSDQLLCKAAPPGSVLVVERRGGAVILAFRRIGGAVAGQGEKPSQKVQGSISERPHARGHA